MALPISKATDLAKDMAKKGIMGSISMGEPKSLGDDMEPDDDMPKTDDLEVVMQDIDKLVPGLGSLIHELVEKCMASTSEPDQE